MAIVVVPMAGHRDSYTTLKRRDLCRSLGPGGECPCCGDPISLAELVASTATSPGITPIQGGTRLE